MNNSALFSFLRIKFAAEDASIALAALRQDALAWQSLEDEQLLGAFLNQKIKDICDLSPARLALISLGCPDVYSGLRERTQFLVDDELQRKSNKFFKEFRTSGRQLSNIQEAGLVSLALREQWRLSQSWKDVFTKTGILEAQEKDISNWKSILACLFGIVPDGLGMLKSLCDLAWNGIAPKILVHVVSANPVAADTQIARYVSLFSGMPLDGLYLSLQSMVVEGYTDLAREIAIALLDEKTNADDLAAISVEEMDSQKLLEHIGAVQTLAGLHQLAGQTNDAARLLKVVEHAARNWQTGLNLQKYYQSKKMGETTRLDQKKVQGYQCKEILAQPEASFLPIAMDNLLEVDEQLNLHPFLQIRKAEHLLQKGEKDSAREIAAGAVQQIAGMVGGQRDLFAPRFVAEWNPLELVDILTTAGLEAEALQFLLIIQQKRPNDSAVLEMIGDLLEKSGDVQNATCYAQMAAILSSNQPERFRRLAGLFEKQQKWKEAYESWAQVIRLNETPETEDWLRFGKSALNAEMPRIAAKACESALEKETDNGSAHALMGGAMRALDRDEDAVPHLQKAVQLLPEIPDYWVDLADAYTKLDMQNEALVTLKSAHGVLPDSALVNHSLGQAYQRIGKVEEALPFFEAAANLQPDSPTIAYELGSNLLSLKKTPQARQFLNKSLKKWPEDVSLAALAAEAALVEEDYANAIPAFEIAIQAENTSSETKLKYVNALFAGRNPLLIKTGEVPNDHFQKAETVLRDVLEKEPFSFAGQLALAEVMSAQKQHQAALDIFRSLVDTPNVTLPDWRWRLFADLGVTADALSMSDIALASLKEATQSAPERLDVLKKLAEVYLHADLCAEAYQTAQNVRNIAPNQVDELIWYADITKRAGYPHDAVEALRCATQFDARHPGLWVELAVLQASMNDEKGARDSLAKMLELDSAISDDLRNAADLYMGWGDWETGAVCLSAAMDLEDEHSSFHLFQLACVQARCGNLTMAEELIRHAGQFSSEYVCMQMLHADLLAGLDRYQGALAILQHAESIESGPGAGFPFDTAMVRRVLPDDWYQSLISDEALDYRIGVLLKKMGDNESALGYLERALEKKPESAVVRYWAVDQADALLQKEKKHAWLKPVQDLDWKETTLDDMPDEAKSAWAALYGLLFDQAIDEENSLRLAQEALDKGLLFDSENAGLMAAKSHCLAVCGDMQAARNSFLAAIKGLAQLKKSQTFENKAKAGFDHQPDILTSVKLRLSKAAFSLADWQNAFQLAEDVKNAHPYEPRILLYIASMIVRLVETNTLYSELKAIRHVPDPSLRKFVNGKYFADLIDTLRSTSKSDEIERWAMRGNMVFSASVENIRSFAKFAQTPSDINALVAALRRSQNYAGAVQIGQKNLKKPEVLLDYGLSLGKTLPDQAAETIRKAIDNQPNQPVSYAGLALVEQEAGHYREALEALEYGLDIWDDEPEWHAWAAQLAELLLEMDVSAAHWEKACQLMPDKLEHVMALAKVLMQKGEVSKAIQILEETSQKAEDQPQVWLLLSKGYLQAKAWQEAMQAAERAASLDRYSAEPVLQSGRIALALGNERKAMECANLALKRAPGEPASVLFLCEVQKAAGKFNEALRILEETINAGKRSTSLLLERTKLIHTMKGAAASAPLLAELSEAEPENAEILGFLAEVQAELGQRHEAGINACRALKLDPQQPGLHYLIGSLKLADGHLDQAVHHFSEAVRQCPDYLEAYLALGEAYLERRENAQALQVYREAMKIAPEDPRLFSKAGTILRDQKDYIGAEELMRRACELSPGDLNIRRQLGAIVALNLVHNPKEVRA